ncbi:MAG: L-histidine N(alpha)-methyltransferase, partial [Dehalococcoidales bacterium]|nr:L-histidine N(alpha)-methyltransferase [Dehalococcoidales bacterium]
MSCKEDKQAPSDDLKLRRGRFRAEVLSGLRKSQKELPSKYFYDEQGSRLFEHICALDEYYIPRTEAVIMETHIEEIIERLGPNVLLIEYGSGNCAKTRILLSHLREPAAYMPIDISQEQLLCTTRELAADYHGLEIIPVCADYTSDFTYPVPKRPSNRIVVYFPGSTISNFDPIPARHFLEHITGVCGP